MKYAAKKIAAMLFTMVIVSLLAFTAFSLISGDAAEIMLGTQVTPERLAALRAELGLDRPLPVATSPGSWAFSPETWASPSSTISPCGT